MHDYAIKVFWSDEDECYIATVPDLKGCSAFGDTAEAAVREVGVAKRLWLEVAADDGDEIPDPLPPGPTDCFRLVPRPQQGGSLTQI